MKNIGKYIYLIAFLSLFSGLYIQTNAAEINDNKSWTKIVKDDWSMEGKYNDCETARIENEKEFGYTRSPCIGSGNNQYYYLCTKSNCGELPSVFTGTVDNINTNNTLNNITTGNNKSTINDVNIVNGTNIINTKDIVNLETTLNFSYIDEGFPKTVKTLDIINHKISKINMIGTFDDKVKVEDITYCQKVGNDTESCTPISELENMGTKNKWGWYSKPTYLSYKGNGIYRESQVFEYEPGKLTIKDLGYFRDIRGDGAKFWLKIKKTDGTEKESNKITFLPSIPKDNCKINGIDNSMYLGGFSIYTNCSKLNYGSDSGTGGKWNITTIGTCNQDEIKIIKSAKKLDYCSYNINCLYRNTYYQCMSESFFNPIVKIDTGDGNNIDNDIGTDGKDVSVIIPKGSNNLQITLKSLYFNENNTYLCNGSCGKLVNGKGGFSYENGVGWHFKGKISNTGLNFQAEARTPDGKSIIKTKFIKIIPKKFIWVTSYNGEKQADLLYNEEAKEGEQCYTNKYYAQGYQNGKVLMCMIKEIADKNQQYINQNRDYNSNTEFQIWYINKLNQLK